jgi:Core-2/I-Branching enzyme
MAAPEAHLTQMARPRHAYLVLAHKEPRLVEALVDRILRLSAQGEVVVHVDLATVDILWDGHPPERVHLVERRQLAWGHWSIVEATLTMMRYAIDELDAAWLVILSGEHWPVADLDAWEAQLVSSGLDALFPWCPLPKRIRFGRSDPDGNRFLARCTHRWTMVRRPRSAVVQKVLSGLSKCSLLLHPLVKLEYSLRNDAWFVGTPRRRGPVKGWALHKGSQWIALDARATRTVLNTSPTVTRWFELSHIPDESYIQTLLVRDGGLAIGNQVVTYVPPEPRAPTPEWMLIKLEDLPQVWASGAAFARKVDPSRRPQVITAIDNHVDQLRVNRCLA